VSILQELMESRVSPETMAEAALANGGLLEEMLAALVPENRNEETRYASHLALVLLSERHPELLYDRWDYFSDLLRAEKGHPKYNAIYILANLARVDNEKKFDRTFRAYFDLLDDPSITVAAHTAANASKIARFRSDLQSRVTKELLAIGSGTGLPSNRTDLVRGYAIQALAEYFDEAQDREEIIEFVYRQTQSTSPKTKKLAKEFLRRLPSSSPAGEH
jgi:hypothetical protein